jgi:spermidine synthase
MNEHDSITPGIWVEEFHRDTMAVRYRVKRTVFSGRSPFQRVDIVETEGYGRMLFNDGNAMISERDEFIYHELIAHVPLFVRPGIRRVLVIGGGDGGTVREVLRHPSVESCHLVEIDRMVVDACREHIPQTASALDAPRAKVTIADGVRFVAETRERFDLVIVDSTDPIGPGAPLFGEAFYRDVHRVLADGGIVVSQAESPYVEADAQRSLLRILHGIFDSVHVYNYANMTYPCGLWSFSFAAKGEICPLADFDPRRVTGSGLEFRFYSPEIHRAVFALPAFQRRALADLLSPPRRTPEDDGSAGRGE